MRNSLRIACALFAAMMLGAAPPTDYVTQVFGIGYDGLGGWDYLAFDSVRNHLFVSRGSHVPVFDTKTTTTAGDIPGTKGVHGIAIAQDLGLGFTSNGGDDSVTVFDLSTLATKTTIAIEGKNPDAILYEPTTRRVYTFDGKSDDATVIDPQSSKVTETIPLPGKPEFAVAGGSGLIYDNIQSKNEIVAIDAKTNAVVHTWPLGGCESPSGLAIDAASHRLFAGCANGVMAVVDAESGRVVTTVPIGAGSDAIVFDPATHLAFSSNGKDATVTVAHEDTPDTYTITQTIKTLPFARTMALDPVQHTLWLSLAKFQTVPEHGTPTREIIEGSFTLLEVLPRELQQELYR